MWRHLQKHLPVKRCDQQAKEQLKSSASHSSSSHLKVNGFVTQQACASIFYMSVDGDGYISRESEMSLTGTTSDGCDCTMDTDSDEGHQTAMNLPAADMNSDSNLASADVVRPTLLPKPRKAKKPPPPIRPQQQQITDAAVCNSHQQTTKLLLNPRGTLYPPSFSAPSSEDSAQETRSTVKKPLPPVCATLDIKLISMRIQNRKFMKQESSRMKLLYYSRDSCRLLWCVVMIVECNLPRCCSCSI